MAVVSRLARVVTPRMRLARRRPVASAAAGKMLEWKQMEVASKEGATPPEVWCASVAASGSMSVSADADELLDVQRQRQQQQLRRVLVAVDTSEEGRHALNWAVCNLSRPGDSFTVIHVNPFAEVCHASVQQVGDLMAGKAPTDLAEAERSMLTLEPEEVRKRMLANSETLLAAIVESQQCLTGDMPLLDIRTILNTEHIGEGSVKAIVDAVLQTADDIDANCIVVGSHCKGWWEEAMHGSVSSALIHATGNSRTVVVVH